MYKQTLNRESNHYRRCPNCDIELMANHGNRKFCSDKCGDDYNNRGKQIIKSMIPPEVPKIETMITPTDHNTFYVKKCIEILLLGDGIDVRILFDLEQCAFFRLLAGVRAARIADMAEGNFVVLSATSRKGGERLFVQSDDL